MLCLFMKTLSGDNAGSTLHIAVFSIWMLRSCVHHIVTPDVSTCTHVIDQLDGANEVAPSWFPLAASIKRCSCENT